MAHQYAAYLALFLLLTGGTAYALAGHNSVHSDDIAKGQVQSSDVHNNGVQGADIQESTLNGIVSIRTRARAHSDVDLSADDVERSYPLSGGIWTQHADETDEFFGQITYTTAPCPPGSPAGSLETPPLLGVYVDGNLIQRLFLSSNGAPVGDHVRYSFRLTTIRFPAGTDSTHELTAGVTSGGSCDGPAGTGTETTVNALGLNVVGYR